MLFKRSRFSELLDVSVVSLFSSHLKTRTAHFSREGVGKLRCPRFTRHDPPPERLAAPVGQAPPQPFERTVQEALQPQRTDDQLQNPDPKNDEEELIELQLAKVVQAVSEEDQRADHRLHDVVRERHLPDGFEAAEQTLHAVRFVEQNDGRDVSHHQEDALEWINQSVH